MPFRAVIACLVMAIVAGVGIWMNIAVQRVEPERWFFPGPLGYEAGVTAATPVTRYSSSVIRVSIANNQQRITDNRRGERGFLTRGFEGGTGPEGSAWERRNGQTKSVSFSHNLEGIFPASLYGAHPEYFPLVDGSRYQPRPGAITNWQPDLGRPDVAVYAAAAAGKHFEANPQAESFSLAINDGLVFGESAETLAALRRADREDGIQMTDGRLNPQTGLATEAQSSQRSDAWGLETQNQRGSGSVSSAPLRQKTADDWFRNRPDYSPLVFTFLNRAAAEFEKTHPDKYLGALAYYWAENAPGFPVDPHVIPFLTADRSQGYDPDFWKEEFALQARWGAAMGIAPRSEGRAGSPSRPSEPIGRKEAQKAQGEPRNFLTTDLEPVASLGNTDKARLGGRIPNPEPKTLNPEPKDRTAPRLGLYDYLDDPAFLIPRIHTRLIAENLRHAREVGFTDYYAEGAPSWGLDGPMHWLVAQLVQDPTQSEDRLLEEYYRRTYGPGAGPMRAFFERCEQIWMGQPRPAYWLKYYYSEDQAGLFPAAVRVELRGLLDEAGSKVGLPRRGDRDPESPSGRDGVPALPVIASFNRYAARVALTSAAFSVTEAYCAFQEARVALSQRVLTADGGGSQKPEDRGQIAGRSEGPNVVRVPPYDSTQGLSLSNGLPGNVDHGGPTRSALPSGLSPQPSALSPSEEILRDLEAYMRARAGFLATVERVRREQPLAIAPFERRDFVKNDPAVAALIAIAAAIRTTDGGRSEMIGREEAQKAQVEPRNALTADDTDKTGLGPQTTKQPQRGLGSASSAALPASAKRSEDGWQKTALEKLHQLPGLPAGWEAIFRPADAPSIDLVRNGALTGPLRPAREIAGLAYGITLPSEWGGSLEPVESHRSTYLPADDPAQPWLQFITPRTLRIEGTKDAAVTQWNMIPSPDDRGQRAEDGSSEAGGSEGQKTGGRAEAVPQPRSVLTNNQQPITDNRSEAAPFYTAAVKVRGKVSPGNLSVLTLGWMDANQRSLGFSTMRLPEGNWPDWVTLQQGGQPPPEARWVGLGVRIEHQTGDDWIEVSDFTLSR